MINQLGKKQFTFFKMLEYGFWPKDIPTPYERQENEPEEVYEERKKMMSEYDELIEQITGLYKTKKDINNKLRELRKEYAGLKDIDKIRKELAKKMMIESIARREARKKQRELEKQRRREAWEKKKQEEIVFIGKPYSNMLYKYETNEEKLNSLGLPIITTPIDLAKILGLTYKQLRFLAYHRDVVINDHYSRYKIPKKRGGMRSIAAPKPLLKQAQRAILDEILTKIDVSENAHGFLKGKSVKTNAKEHGEQPSLLIKMDIKDFFPTITFERVRGIFVSFGYSGHISTLLSMLCTYCERMPIEINGEIKYVATTKRILPQGSPASPMITNIICRRLDKRLKGLANKFNLKYTRYADDMSFTIFQETEENIGRFCGLVYSIVEDEDFKINNKKTRFLRKNNQQNMTGIVLNNEEISVPRRWIKNFRAALYNAQKILDKEGTLPLETLYEISGMVSWIKSINQKRYIKLINQAKKLIKAVS